MSVTQDSASRKYVPATTTEWTELLSGLGIASPSSIWLLQETSGSLADSGSGGRTVTVAGTPAYAQTAPGWTRRGIKPTDGSVADTGICTIPNVNASSAMLLQMFSVTSVATATRDLNHIGASTAEHAQMLAGNKLRGQSDASNSDGVQQHTGTLVVVTKFDRANSVLGVYTQHEQLKPTYAAPAGDTNMYLFGGGAGASDATLVYAAAWFGSDAEISDSLIQDLLDGIDGDELTIEKMEAGSFAHKWVVAIEGCPYLLSDAPSAAVLNAYAGRDWTQALGGLFVELQNDQAIAPLEAFTTSGRCTIRVLDTTGVDTFGKHVFRRAGGDETSITETVDRNDTTIPVKGTAEFASSGEVWIGTECIGYTGVTATSFTGCTRGKYSPFGTALSGAGGVRFANHHRVGTNSNHVQMNPVVSSLPRVWIGKRVAVRLHTWDAVNQTINARAEAQLVFAGRISGVSDDHNTFHTVIEVDHMQNSLRETVLFQTQLCADVAPGLALIEGRQFDFTEGSASGNLSATPLVVVAGAPADAFEIQAGTYSLTELTEGINRWLSASLAAAEINGHYSFSSPVSSNEGMRTRCHWINDHPTDTGELGFGISIPSEVAGFLGLTDGDPALGGMTVIWAAAAMAGTQTITDGPAVPFTTLVFRPQAARLGVEFAGSPYVDFENVRGTFVDQYDRLPASIKGSCDASAEWGVFLFDEKVLVVGNYDDGRLRNFWIAPIPLAGDNSTESLGYFGRRADEPNAGPVKIRQILMLEGTFSQLVLELLYSSGVAGYNHETYDTLGFGFGAAMPGELLGPEFERAVENLPNADAPLMVLLDEPKQLEEAIGSDLNFRWAFVRWKDQHFEIANWKTPLNALAVETLTESNKAAPVDSDENHRVASEDTDEHQYSTIKIEFGRDFAVGRNGDYTQSVSFEDQTAVDDAGDGARTATISLRNTFAQYVNTGSSVEAGLPEFMVHMPSISRASRKIARSVDHRYFESIAPGDIVTVEDNFARDPLTGARGVNSRAAFVVKVSYSLGGPTGMPDEDASPIDGEIVVNFLDTQRGQAYAPAADVDETQNSGGFSAGYDSGGPTLRCYEHHYSHAFPVRFGRGTFYLVEPVDIQNFNPGDKIMIVERDPPDPATALSWERTIDDISENDGEIILTSALSLPAWDATKRYRIVPQKYSQVQSSQHEVAYQADDADEMVEDTEIPWHLSAGEESYGYNANTPSSEPAEFVSDLCFGDGRPWDVGTDQSIGRYLNAFHDYKSAHQAPYLHDSILGLYDEITASWFVVFCGPIFLGTEHLSSSVTRSLTVAPFYRSGAGGTAKLRITILRAPPVAAAGVGFLPGEQYRDSIFTDHFSQSAEYTTTSTTWQTGADATLSLDTKDIWFGFVWVLIEGQGDVESRGLAKCIEGPRE